MRKAAHGGYLLFMNTTVTGRTWTSVGDVPEWTITDRLRKARELTGLDQGEFASEIGVSRGTVSNYERGSNVHKKSVLMTWAMRSGVPLEWLQTGQQEAPHPAGPVEGLDAQCAVRDSNPEPADINAARHLVLVEDLPEQEAA